MRLPIPRTSATVGLVAILASAPVAAHAQVEGIAGVQSGGQELMEAGPLPLDGQGSSFGDRYLLGTMALGVPSAVVSAMNLRGGPVRGLWLGLAGIGMGVGHGALFVAGFQEVDSPMGATVWWNGIASAYSAVSGILQIRSTIGDGPDSSSLRASITPEIDGVRLRVTWKR